MTNLSWEMLAKRETSPLILVLQERGGQAKSFYSTIAFKHSAIGYTAGTMSYTGETGMPCLRTL